MLYAVTYDLNKPGKDYSSLWSALRQYEHTRDVALDSVWFISTPATAAQVYEHLRHFLDQSDRIYIFQLTRNHEGWMEQSVWDWINARL